MLMFLGKDFVQDDKKRDGLVLKFVRKVKDPSAAGGEVFFTPRNLW